MDEEKLRMAFGRIKYDMELIQKELNILKKTNTLNQDVKNQLEEIKGYHIDKFINSLENEFKSMNSLIREFNHRFKENSEEMKKLAENLQKYHFEITNVKKKLLKESNITANAELDIKILDEKLNELHEIMNEKITLENAQGRLEVQSELARMASEINDVRKKNKKSVDTDEIKESINEIAEMLNEKLNLELNSLRLEFTEELAKLYDRIPSKSVDSKEEPKKKSKKSKSSSEKLY